MRRDPPHDVPSGSRRRLLAAGAGALGLAALPPGALGAAPLAPTPRQSLGPFYPRELPADSDNDLVRIAGREGNAAGVITHLDGRVLDASGRPLPGSTVEIWQCDANGRYHHPGDRRASPRDEAFQGYGRFVTGTDGAYRFRTIRPVAYPGRAPHVHFAIHSPGREPLVTQMYVAGMPENDRDFLLGSVRDPAARASLIVDLRPHPGAPGELVGRFDVVLAVA